MAARVAGIGNVTETVSEGSEVPTVLVAVLIRETVPFKSLTNTLDPSGLTATKMGFPPTVIEVTALVVVLMRETVPSPKLATHLLDPSGLTAPNKGFAPTVIRVSA